VDPVQLHELPRQRPGLLLRLDLEQGIAPDSSLASLKGHSSIDHPRDRHPLPRDYFLPHVITLGWLQIAALLGAVQGFFLTVVLAAQRRNRTANRLLAVAMFAFSIHLATVVYHAAGWEPRFPHFFGAAYPLPLLYGPLIYLYAVTASDRIRGFRWYDGLHFLPFGLVMLVSLPVYLMSGAEKLAFYHELQQGARPLLLRVVDPLKIVSGVGYTVATIRFLLRHRALVKESYASLEPVNLQWLLRLGLAGALIWGLATVFELMPRSDLALLRRGDDAVALALAVLVYWIGYMALRQPEIFNFAGLDRAPVAETAPPPASSAQSSETASRPYERSGLSEREAAALKDSLLSLMAAVKPYRDSDLTLADLAGRLGTTPHRLSQVLNTQLNQTFYDFVNAWRVREVQRRMADEGSRNLTILSLALDAGFASKSTFNHVFRQHTGQTPSAWRKSINRPE
jgi:AraC-like DNA-binding protein